MSRFDVYRLQTNKQTNRQAKFIYEWYGKRFSPVQYEYDCTKVICSILAEEKCVLVESDSAYPPQVESWAWGIPINTNTNLIPLFI